MKKHIRKIYYALPLNLRYALRGAFYLPTDLFNKQYFNGIELPPKGMIYTGGGDFLLQAKKHTKYLQDFVGLDSNSKVLDIGSGIGRSAIGLTDVLKDKGEYYGFDIVDTGVNWCNNNISSKFPNFHFKHIEIINDLYSNTGVDGKSFQFPYADSKFDIAFLISVFTHMQVEEISNYLKEINRVLNNNGKCMATFLLYDDKIEDKISNPKFRFSFQYEYDNYRLMNNKVKNANIALSKTLLNDMAIKNNLKIERIIDGFWSEEVEIINNDFQDIVIFSK